MYNFDYHIPTKIFFGKGQIVKLPTEIKAIASKILLVYGGGSIKRNGIYDTLLPLLKEEGIEVHELSGVEPNPRVTTVAKGAQMCKDFGIEAVLAVGGGSTIDCTKVIAAAAFYDGDPWDLVTRKAPITNALPVFSVLTAYVLLFSVTRVRTPSISANLTFDSDALSPISMLIVFSAKT